MSIRLFNEDGSSAISGGGIRLFSDEQRSSIDSYNAEYVAQKKKEEEQRRLAAEAQAKIDAERNKPLLQKVGEYISGQANFVKENPVQAAKNVGSTFVSGIKAAGEDMSAPLTAGIYNKANEDILRQKQEGDNRLIAKIKTTTDPAQKQKLLQALNSQPDTQIDVMKEVQPLNKTPLQVYSDFAMLGLDMLGFAAAAEGIAVAGGKALMKSGVKGFGGTVLESGTSKFGVSGFGNTMVKQTGAKGLTGAMAESGSKSVVENLVKKTFFRSVLEGAGWGSSYGSLGAAQQGGGIKDIAKGAIIGGTIGAAIPAVTLGIGKGISAVKDAPMNKIRQNITNEYETHLITNVTDAKIATELLDNGSKSLKISASLPESLTHIGEDLSQKETLMASEEGQRSLASTVVHSKMSPESKKAVYNEIVNSGLFKVEKGDSQDEVIQKGIESILANGENIRPQLNLTSNYTDSVLGVINPQLNEMETTLAEKAAGEIASNTNPVEPTVKTTMETPKVNEPVMAINTPDGRIYTKLSPEEQAFFKDEINNVIQTPGKEPLHIDSGEATKLRAKQISREDFLQQYPEAQKSFDKFNQVPEPTTKTANNITITNATSQELQDSGVVKDMKDYIPDGGQLIKVGDKNVGWVQIDDNGVLQVIEVLPEYRQQGIARNALKQLFDSKEIKSFNLTEDGKKLMESIGKTTTDKDGFSITKIENEPVKQTPTSPPKEIPIEKGATTPAKEPTFPEKTGQPRKIPDEVINSEKFGQIYDELASAEAGKRYVTDSGETVAKKSSFPTWVPDKYTKENGTVVSLRDRKLFDKVQEHLTEGTVPTDETQLALYDIIHNEARLRSDMPQVEFPSEGRVVKDRRVSPEKPVKSSSNEKAVDSFSKRYNESFDTGIEPTAHDISHHREQIKKALDMAEEDYPRLVRIAIGVEKSDEVLSNAAAKIVLENAVKDGDAEAMRLVLVRTDARLTRAGQEVEFSKELTKSDSAFGAVRDVVNSRRKAVEEKIGKGKKISTEVNKTVKEIESNITKNDKTSWTNFVNNIRC